MTDTSGVEPQQNGGVSLVPVVQPTATTGMPKPDLVASQARENGVDWGTIQEKEAEVNRQALAAGLSQEDINKFNGNWSNYGAPPTTAQPGLLGSAPPAPHNFQATPDTPDFPSAIRSFAQKYLGPDNPNYAVGQIRTAGDFFKAMDYDITDVGKWFGAPVVNGAAAIMEGLDGRARTRGDLIRLGVEAEGFLGLTTGDRPSPAALAEKPVLQNILPSKTTMIDAGTALARGTGHDIDATTEFLGRNFVQTGEDPAIAVARAQGDPAVMKDFGARIDASLEREKAEEAVPVPPEDKITRIAALQADREASNAGERAAGSPASSFSSIEAQSRAEEALKPGVEPSTPAKIALTAGQPSPSDEETPPSLWSSEGGALAWPRQPLINPATLGVPNPALAENLVGHIKLLFAPQTLAPEAAGIIRSDLARGQVVGDQTIYQLRQFGRAMGELSSKDRSDFLDAYETGNYAALNKPVLQRAAQAIHDGFDKSWAEMNSLGVAPNYVTNYIGHLFQDPAGVNRFWTGKGSLEGNKSFTRERTYQLISQAVAAGHKLVTDDPVELAVAQLNSQRQFITAHHIINDLNTRGMTSWIDLSKPGVRVPPGMMAINDKIATGPQGRLFAPEPIAKMLNRYLSPGFSKNSAYEMARTVIQTQRQMTLVGSLFHPLYLGIDSISAQLGLSFEQLTRGVTTFAPMDIARSAKTFVTAPAAPLVNFLKGQSLTSAVLKNTLNPMQKTITDAMIEGGARFKSPETYHSSAAGNFWASFKSVTTGGGAKTPPQEIAQLYRDAPPVKIAGHTVLPGYVRATSQVFAKAMDTISAPIMDVVVPNMKVGAIAQQMQDMLRTHPNLSGDALRIASGKIVDQVDRRLGEMTQDHLFWDKGVTDIANLVYFAPEWWYGKLQLMGATSMDLLKGGFSRVEPGAPLELSKNLSYLMGAVGGTLMTGGVYGYLHGTWNKDWTFKDYLYPQTGGNNPDGSPEHAQIPNILNEMYGWTRDPEHEHANKLNKIWHDIPDLFKGVDEQGASIIKPGDTGLIAAGDMAKFLSNLYSPIIGSGHKNDSTAIPWFEHTLGLRPPPFDVNEAEQAKRYNEKDKRKADRKRERLDIQDEE